MPRLIALLTSLFAAFPAFAADAPTKDEARDAFRKAVAFYHTKAATNGGYVWRYSGDLQHREGEAIVGTTTIWVQPPGTPTVGEAFLEAYELTGDTACLEAARDAAAALLQGQMSSGGWHYSVEFDPEKRAAYGYRDQPARRKQRTETTLDDDTTQSALRFLIRMDQALDFKDEAIHETVEHGMNAIIRAQFPNGGWYVWWREYPTGHRESNYPVVRASYPDEWPRTWTKAFDGRYVLNDDLMPDIVELLLLAYDTYGDERYLEAVRKAGDFLILAQMPDPQPAWAQQYNKEMHPTWARKFEPPAVTGGESQGVIETLMVIYERTGDRRYLEPIPRALAYLKASQVADGRLARFYELRTNKPLYFVKDTYELTYSSDNLPTHYGFIVGSKLDRLEERYNRVRSEAAGRRRSSGTIRLTDSLAAEARRVIDDLDERGAWVESGRLKEQNRESRAGVIRSETFCRNLRTLSRFIAAK